MTTRRISRHLLPSLLLSSILFAPAAFAQTPPQTPPQTQPASAHTFDPAATLDALAHAPDAHSAFAILDKLTDAQMPPFVSAFDPARLPDETRTAIFDHLLARGRRLQADRLKQQRAAENAWDLRTGIQTYHSSGNRNPAWDTLVADAFNNDHYPLAIADCAKRFKAALDAGCTDPLVRYYYIRRALPAGLLTPAQAYAQYRDLLPAMDKSPYSPARKFQVRAQLLYLAARDLNALPDAPNVARQMYNDMIHDLPSLAPEHCGIFIPMDAVRFLRYAGPRIGFPQKDVYDRVAPCLPSLFGDNPYPDYLKARTYIDWAWEARGGGWASSVTDQGWQLFSQRLKIAEQAAIAGATRDPLEPRCPTQMITICMGLSYDRPTMEKWFTQAMIDNPDNYVACSAKYTYLLPRWFGSPREELDFARECLRFGSVESRIPTLFITARFERAEDADDKSAYLARPEVWADIDAVYQKLLSDPKNPRLRFDRAKQIVYAYQCQQWQTVLTLMNKYKDDIDFSAFGSKAVYTFYKKKATQALANAPS